MTVHAQIGEIEARPTLAVVILYEDWRAGLRAKQAFEQLEQNITPEMSFSLSFWRFDLLEEQALRDEAASAAADSDIVLVSAHGHTVLPGAVISWLNQWLLEKPIEPTALVISLDTNTKSSATANQILSFLAQVVEPAGVELFFHFGHTHYLRSEPTIKSPLLPEQPANIPTCRHPWEH